MASCSNAQSLQDGNVSREKILSPDVSLDQSTESPKKPDDNDDRGEGDDVDFDPFLKESLSPEASSSLSSEVEVLDSSEMMDEEKSTALEDADRVEENVILSATESSDKQVQNQVVPDRLAEEENSQALSQKKMAIENFQARDHEQKKAADFDDDDDSVNEEAGQNKDLEQEEDAICKRTRARYSLASFTLDELESFLQETDDDDDLQNVDDEKEYRKFLAAVLQGIGDGEENLLNQVNENVDDEEDEDNDADFEIELEEALDSDLDEKPTENTQQKGSGRRPETRQNRRLKKTSNENKFMELGKRPLRPLLPLLPIPNFPLSTSHAVSSVLADATLCSPSTIVDGGYINGFTPNQIFQLHCLVHEHMQLLIQIYSLCVLDPSRQRVALQMQELILEILHKRDQVLSWRNVPYPGDIFQPPYVVPSVVSDQSLRILEQPIAAESCLNGTNGVSSTYQLPAENVCPSEGRQQYVPPGPMRSSLAMKDFPWVPNIRVPILSVLDVEPLKLVKAYFDEMSTVVRDRQRRNVESSGDNMLSEKVPLFPLANVSSVAEVNPDGMTSSTDVPKVPSSSSQPHKKSLAAALVETTKKQSVALVPKEVANLAQIYLPFFNQALFPHKPPPVGVTNRVLFTDAEDELLALGMMAYNTDWKAIQQHYLPCKSKHQIFVRQKNRCSAKAPDNPIKAVRRMKTSPLTVEELRYINEGLKIYKLDWISVWKLIVPHRDPSLLPRQWRVATGTQKSYKQDHAKKERRRMYEAERRKRRAADLPSWQQHGSEEDNQAEEAGEENNSSGDDCIDDPEEEEEAYVHEAFLSDWRPGSNLSSSSSRTQNLLPQGREQLNSSRITTKYQAASNFHQLPWPSNTSHQRLHHPPPYGAASLFTAVGHHHVAAASGPPPHMMMMPIRPPVSSTNGLHQKSLRTTKTAARLVKLAPNLPAVNLPQNVRVLSHSSSAHMRSHHHHHHQSGGPSSSAVVSATRRDTTNVARTENNASSSSRQYTAGTTQKNGEEGVKEGSGGVVVVQERSRTVVIEEEETTRSSNVGPQQLQQMHPLLFHQVPPVGGGRLPYYPLLNTTGTTATTAAAAAAAFNFFSGYHQQPPQLDLNLLRNNAVENNDASSGCLGRRSNKSTRAAASTSRFFGIEFHPLLQRCDDDDDGDCNLQSSVGPSNNDFDSAEPTDDGSLGPTCGFPSSLLDDRNNELDLEIHLSSTTSKKQKDVGSSRDQGASYKNPIRRPEEALVESHQNISQLGQGHASGVDKLIPPRSHTTLVALGGDSMDPQCNIMDNQSNPPGGIIIMEQEELSDSDEEEEEVDEDIVEFECEEMDDSEGEEAPPSMEQDGIGAHNKQEDVRNLTKENVVVSEHEETIIPNQPGSAVSSTPGKKDSETSLDLWLPPNEQRKKNKLSWLSLDSSSSSSSSARCNNHGGPKRVNKRTSRPVRVCKKAKPPTTKNNEESSTSPAAAPPATTKKKSTRPPRKRVKKSDTAASSSIGAAAVDNKDNRSSGSTKNDAR